MVKRKIGIDILPNEVGRVGTGVGVGTEGVGETNGGAGGGG